MIHALCNRLCNQTVMNARQLVTQGGCVSVCQKFIYFLIMNHYQYSWYYYWTGHE